MNKKTLSRIAALSIAAASAVSTLGMTASAVVGQPDRTKEEYTIDYLYKVTIPNGSGGSIIYYYDETKARTAASSSGGTCESVVSSTWLPVNNYFTLNELAGTITNAGSTGTMKFIGTGYSGGSSSGSSYDGSYDYSQLYNITSGNKYATNYYWESSGPNGTHLKYPNEWAARQAEPNGTFTQHEITNDFEKWSPDRKYFDVNSGAYTYTGGGSRIYISTNYGYSSSYSISTSYRTSSSSTVYYYNGVYYPNYNNMVASLGFTPSSGSYSTYTRSSSEAYSSSRPYFDPRDGIYYSTSSGGSGYRVLINSGYGTYTVYYSSDTGKYYDTYSAALSASRSSSAVSSPISSYYSASTLNTYGYSPYNNSYYYDGYYYNGYYYNGYYPYSYYYNTTATKDTSTATIGKYKGWTNVATIINTSRSGASYDVDMKSETTIPSNVLKALKGKNVTVTFKFKSGATLAVNGNNVTSTDALTTDIKYEKNVTQSLVNKAVKVNGGVSSAQFSISGGSLGATASVNIKFAAKRAGCSANLYRYNASANSLSLVSTSTVKSNGNCTFGNVKQGGDYVVVLY